MNKPPFYQQHVLLCTNQRGGGRACCSELGAPHALERCKARVKQLRMFGPGKIHVSSSGCLGRCELGPTLVVYPQGIWYSYVSAEDIDAIVDQHLGRGDVVERLRI